ncbi:MAG: tetratricopeptide repeat protein [Cellulosilyticaceae bacterium]
MSKELSTQEISPLYYLDVALKESSQQHPLQTLNYIDLSISLATNKQDFILKKIEFLYEFRLYSQCTDYIILHFSYLYNHCPLSQFAQIIYYYRECTQCLTEELHHILLENHVPILLAILYKNIMADEATPFVECARTSYSTQEYDLCIQYVSLAHKESKADAELLQLKALAHEALGQHQEAANTYKSALQLAPASLKETLYFSLGQAFEQLQKYQDADYCYSQALMMMPLSLTYQVHHADCLFKWGKRASARLAFRRIIHLFPNDAYSYLRLGELYELKKQFKLAKYYYAQARRIKQNKLPRKNLRSKLLGL